MALITATEAKVLLPALSGTGADTSIDTMISRAGQALAEYCAFPAVAGAGPTLEQTTYTMYLDGLDEDARRPEVLQLPLRPIVSVTSVYDDADRAYGSSAQVAEADHFSVDKTGGALVLLGTSTHAWSVNAFEALKVVAVCGLTAGSIPELVKAAVAVTVQANWSKRHTATADQVGVGGDTFAPSKVPYFVPAEAKGLIAPWVLWERKLSGAREVRFA